MKPGLSLRVSQHLALTPQLQQSIRLLQLSTLELASEVEQMLDDNPFLEREDDSAAREEFGLQRADARVSEGDRSAEGSTDNSADGPGPSSGNDESEAPVQGPDDWEGDGSLDLAPDDGEWGGDAPARHAGAESGDEVDAAERTGSHESLTEHLHRQALSLRLSGEDMAALRFLIESINDDGYLEDSLAQLAATLTDESDDLDRLEELGGRCGQCRAGSQHQRRSRQSDSAQQSRRKMERFCHIGSCDGFVRSMRGCRSHKTGLTRAGLAHASTIDDGLWVVADAAGHIAQAARCA